MEPSALRLPEHSDTHSGICQCNFGTVNLNYQLFLEIVNYVSRTLNILEMLCCHDLFRQRKHV